MSDWQEMPAPQNQMIVVAYDDGEVTFIPAEDNDYDWIAYKGKRLDGIQRPKYFMSIPKAPH